MITKIKMTGLLALLLIIGLTMTGCGAFTKTDRIYNYLSFAVQVGRSSDGPLPLAVRMNLDDDWNNLIQTINNSGVRVNLDLSRCTMDGTVFNPGDNGSDLIVSLVLPDSVTKLEGSFYVFPNLTSIRFPASVEMEYNPFWGDITFKLKGRGDLSVIEDGRALVRNGNELVAYPSASGNITLNDITVIGTGAFGGAAIQEINLPRVTNVGMWAFSGCNVLHTVNLPAATVIQDYAFYYNTSLGTLNIPAARNLGDFIFGQTGNNALTINAGQPFETIGARLFDEVWTRKNVTVSVPQSAVEDVTAQRDALRGRGWNEGALVYPQGRNETINNRNTWVQYLNANINLTVASN